MKGAVDYHHSDTTTHYASRSVVAGMTGFVCAMRSNPDFNRTIRHTAAFRPLTGSRSQLIRSSLALPQLSQNYDEIENFVKKESDF